MTRSFCKTWWGNAWLQALAHIDYSNRIPRGARYARNGSVKNIDIADNHITAQVQGSRPRPYTVKIAANKFTPAETKRLMDSIMAHPSIVPQLLNMNLSPTVLDIAKEANVSVFPTSWKDLDMHCNCPDWAVPCKHIAAVVYMIGREIDNNPFLVFQLHGVDLLEELRKRGLEIDKKQSISIPTWQEVLPGESSSDVVDGGQPVLRTSPDFSKIRKLGNALLRIIPDAPPFYTKGNFSALYAENIERGKKQAERVLLKKADLTTTFLKDLTPEDALALSPSDNLTITVRDGLQFDVSQPHKKKKASAPALMMALDHISPDALDDYNDTIYALQKSYVLALHLARLGNVTPLILESGKNTYAILWTPATQDEETKALLQQIDTLYPADSIKVKDGKKTTCSTRSAWLMTSCFLTLLMCGCAKPQPDDDNKAYHIFYTGTPQSFTKIGEQSIPLGIKSWLDHLTATNRRWRPIVLVSDKHEDAQEFLLELAVEDSNDNTPDTIRLHDIFTKPEYRSKRFTILKDLSLLSSLIPGLDAYLAHEAQAPISLNNSDFTAFLLNMAPAMELLGIKLLLPKSLKTVLRPLPSVKITAKPNDGKTFMRMDQLLEFDWRVAIGDELVSAEDFEKLAVHADELIRFKQRYIYVSAEDLKKLEKAFASQREMTPAKMLQVALSGEYKGATADISPEVKALIKEWTTLDDTPVPDEIHAQLRPYQQRGYSWMYHNMRLGFGSILADDMGLGKTLQAITLLQKLKDEKLFGKKHAIVIAPTGLLANWQAELQRFAPSLSVFLYHGARRDIKDFHHDVLLTSYGIVRTDNEKIKKLKWQVAVIDEAQNIKNNDTAQSKTVRSLKADVHIALSGTPVENRLSEYWSIMDFANKGYLGTMKTFNDDYAKPIQDSGDKACAERFRRITSPLMMRRLKTDKAIISDLPDKISQDEFAMLTPTQAALYQKVVDESMKVITGIDDNDSQQLFKRQGLILQMMLALKQICNHPTQYLKDGNEEPSLSGKTEMLLDLVDTIRESGEKALIFTQFKEMGDILQRCIAKRTGTTPMFLHGGCTIKQRKEMVDRFQNNRQDRIFILSLKAAGTGLNLTAATHVVHYDLWWNPAVEAQATDRAYRIGQKKNVMVHRFITHNTFEERINDMINSKRTLAELTVASGENWIGKLSNRELKEIFG